MEYRDKLFLHNRKPCEFMPLNSFFIQPVWLKTFAIYAVKCKVYLTGMVDSLAEEPPHY